MLAVMWAITGFSQCADGEVEVSLQFYTDAWGYEVYWELLPTGVACGEGAIATGGNGVDVGCDGDGIEGSEDTAYDNGAVILVEDICLTEGELYDLVFVDDYGDGGLIIEVFFDGQLAALYSGTGFGNTWTFEAGLIDLPAFDSPCGASEVFVDGDILELNNEEAIASVAEVSPGGGNCQVYGIWCEGGVTNSVWATFTAPESGSVIISTCNDSTTFDSQLAVWTYEDCIDQSTFSLVSSNDDIAGGCGSGAFYASECYASCLEAGETYLIQVDGWNGATGDVGITVTSYDGETSVQAAVGNILCAPEKGEDATGSIQPYVVGWGADFTTTWTGPNDFTSEENSIFGLDAGTYSATFDNGCGEELTAEYEITISEPYNVGVTLTQPSCLLSTDGAILVDVGGATPPYEITITSEEGEFVGSEITDLPVGEYTVVVTDDFGCEYVNDVTLIEENALEFSLGEDFTICNDEDSLLYGPPGYLYEWNDGSINQFNVVNGAELGPGTFAFILNAYNAEGCEFTDAIIVTVWDCVNSIEELEAATLALYPNPSEGSMQLNGLPVGWTGSFRISDYSGRVVYEEQLSQHSGQEFEFDLDLPQGMYQLLIDGGEAPQILSFIIK